MTIPNQSGCPTGPMNNFKPTLMIWLALFASAALVNIVWARSDQDISPQHDDHSTHDPVEQSSEADACASGVSAGYACRNIEMMSRVPLADMGGGTAADSWGWIDPKTGRYYAIVGRSNGTSFVDVTEPDNPVYLGQMPSTSGDQPWRDVKVYARHAFVVADSIPDHGMQIFALPRLRDVTEPGNFSPNRTYTEFGPAHNIAINEVSGYAYAVGTDTCSGGLHMIDISNPKMPEFAGCFSEDGYTHDVQCVNYEGPDPDHQDSEICFAANEDTMTVIDVTDKDNPVMLSRAEYPDVGYAHQGWLTEDHTTFFMGDEVDEDRFGMNTRTLAFDVEDLDEAHFSGAFHHGTTSIDHNLYVHGNLLYEANYKAGLRILQINDAHDADLTEIAYFDTVPASDTRDFAGAWNVYPFFDNDIVLVTDVESGLFVLRTGVTQSKSESSPLNGSLSGAWVAENLKDQSLMLFVGENNQGPFVFFAWFLYLDGEPFWLVGDAAFEYGEDEVSVLTQSLAGLQFLSPGADHAMRTDVGTLNIHVHGCDELHLDYDFGALGEGELDMSKLIAVEGRDCKASH